jgi:signal transduction histidine kinase
LEDVVSESVRIVTDSISCERAAILLYEEETDSLVAQRPVYGLKDAEIDKLRVSLVEPSLAGTVYRTSTPMTSNDAENDAWVSTEMCEVLGAKNLTAVPLTTGRKPIGILKAVNAESGSFDDDDERFLSVLGSQVGSVIDAIRARESERALLSELRELDRTRSEFISMLAHELRGPMTTIMGFGYTLRDSGDKLDDEKKLHVISTMVRETERLSRMVTDLLDLSRMEAGSLKYECEPLEIKDFTDALIETHSSLKAHHFVEIEVPDGLPKVLADRDRLHQVFINLLTNATRYSAEGTTITLRAEDADDHVRVAVSDQGIGIQKEDADRIFEKFAMLPKPSWVKKGTGLGLFITKTLVEAMGGSIWVETEQGKGSTFVFTLPHANDR